MKAFFLLFFLCASSGWTQSAPPASSDNSDKVIAVFEADGSKITQGELQALIPVLPDTWRTLAEQNPERFLHVLGVLKRASAAARSENLADKAPYKQGMDFAIIAALAQFYVHESTSAITVMPEELEKYYNEHKEPFRRIKVSGIKVAFGTAATPADAVNASRIPKKALTEDDAKTKADKLVTQIRGGADFAKLVQTDSDDEASKAKGGDLGVWSMTDNIPDALRTAVLNLREGEVSEPIRQPGSFYIVHADAVTYAPLAEVKDTLFAQLQAQKASDWLKNFDKDTKVDLPKNDPVPPAPSDTKK
jgi:peptidyl-prolyl cis-trans isomerase C